MDGDLPVRRSPHAPDPGTRPRGRHRRQPAQQQNEAPGLVLTVPGGSARSDTSAATVSDIVAMTEELCPAVAVRAAYLDSGDDECLAAVLGDFAGVRRTPSVVVVPLLTGPHSVLDEVLRETVSGSPAHAVVAPALGPHPLLAEALHERLSEAGLARVQHVGVLSVSIAADGVVVAASGGEQAVGAAEVTAVLLAARLAVPVVSAPLPDEAGDADTPGLAAAVSRVRQAGARRVALAPYVIGPEAALHRLTPAAQAQDVEAAGPLGAHRNVARLVAARYDAAVAAR